MSVGLDHTIISARDKYESANFMAEILGLPEPETFEHFLVLRTSNGVSLDFNEVKDGEIRPQHYAFLVSEKEFDEIFARIVERGLPYWADPRKRNPGKINTRDGGRGFYFEEPSGHFLEIMTRRYGSGTKGDRSLKN